MANALISQGQGYEDAERDIADWLVELGYYQLADEVKLGRHRMVELRYHASLADFENMLRAEPS